MTRRVFLTMSGVLTCLAFVWVAAAFLPLFQRPVQFSAPTFHPVPGAEPISPIPRSLPLDAARAALGKRLFHDQRLSGDNTLACSSCHILTKGGADGTRKSRGVRGQFAERNTPTVFNAVFNFRQFWDGRAETLEDQVDGPIYNPKEMASNWVQITAKLGEDAQYRAAFRKLYGSGIEPQHIRNAIAEFERSLITPGSRFDRYLEGDKAALNAEELRGYRLFKSYGCIACHQGVNVGGNLYERLGVLKTYADAPGQGAATDLGRMAVTGRREDALVFKVPGLRNVTRTAPYFHDGSIATLEQAVVLMGQYQLGVAIPNDDVALIVKFLDTLSADYEDTLP